MDSPEKKGGDELCCVALHDCGGWQMVTVIDQPNTLECRRMIAKEVADSEGGQHVKRK